jgi:hypothetical protein
VTGDKDNRSVADARDAWVPFDIPRKQGAGTPWKIHHAPTGNNLDKLPWIVTQWTLVHQHLQKLPIHNTGQFLDLADVNVSAVDEFTAHKVRPGKPLVTKGCFNVPYIKLGPTSKVSPDW